MAGETYEVQVCRGGRWQIESVGRSEQDAVSEAKRKVSGPGVEGVKVIKDSGRQFSKPVTVFEQKGRVADGELITLAPIESAPQRCEKPADLYGGGARQTMAKLFKNYSSKMNITVSEVLYNARELKRVMEKDNLVSSAVARIASLQSTAGDQQGAKARRDDLFSMLDQCLARAYQAEKTELPSITKVGFTALEQAVAEKAPDPEQKEYLTRVAISRELIGERSFQGKLDNAIKWAEGVDSAVEVGALDDFIADTLNDAALVQDLLGPRENLLAAIVAMLDLIDGRMAIVQAQAEQRKEINATGERLNKLIGAARLPQAVVVLNDRVRSMVASKNPLTRTATPADEKTALRALVERLVPVDGALRATPELLDGLIERAARLINMGGAQGRNEGLAYIADLLPEPARKLRLLIAVYESALREALEPKLVELIKRWIAETPTANAAHPASNNPAFVMRGVTNMFYQIRDSGLGDEPKQWLTGHLDTLLYKYVVEAKILERVDDPNRPLHLRAKMLMSMCLPDMLPPGKAVEAARPRVIGYLRQPDFTTQVVASIADPAEKEKTLRELFDLMRRAGFK
jgi:hypothetical protein